jgi:hypothetical protein
VLESEEEEFGRLRAVERPVSFSVKSYSRLRFSSLGYPINLDGLFLYLSGSARNFSQEIANLSVE